MIDDDHPRVFVPPPLIFCGLLTAGLLFDHAKVAWDALRVVAIIGFLVGLGLIAIALGLFRSNHTRPEPWKPSSALVSDGIYRFTRNPMYLGMAVASLAIALLFVSLTAALLTLAAVAIVDRLVIAREEDYLARRFGEEYASYRQRVRRWL